MAKREAQPEGAVALPGPRVDPRVQNPKALAYAEGLRGRRGPQVPKYNEPVNGGPNPPIPLLSGDPQGGMTMAAQAELERGPRAPRAAGGILQDVPVPSNLAPGLMGGGGIQMGDILPDEARQDPRYKGGVGAMYAQNQPELAKQYGVIRNGERVPPQKLMAQPPPGAPRGQLRPETLKGLEALHTANQETEPSKPAAPAKPVAKPAVEESPVEEEKKPLSEEERKEVLSQMDDFDFSRFRAMVSKDLLNNDTQKAIIEKRLKPLDIVDLIVKGRVTQTVEIVPGKFEVTLQSYLGEEDLQIKRWISQEIKTLEAPDRYFEDKYKLMGMTIAIKAINKRQLPDCYDAEGNLVEDLFWQKFNMVSRFDFHMLSSLHINWCWFDMRVRKLFVAEELGNG